ncbi:MAG: hypothetical protein M0R50_05985 [Candidatus Cloacimonetes bacterium]|jgi:exonuclease VII large subunit|nr:hypothetical protein [Candidatus Cloacimonadota bacterium]
MAAVSKHDDCPFKDVVFPDRAEKITERDNAMDRRVGRLEGVVESLTRDIQEVSQNIGMMNKELTNFRETIGNALTSMRDDSTAQLNAVTDRLTASSKPQWQTISAFAALAITLLGMAGAVVALIMSGQSENITNLKRDTATITERMFQNQYEKGKSDAFAAETGGRISNLQREIALIQQASDAKIAALDKNASEYNDKVAEILKEFRTWRLEFVSKTIENSSKLSAKQDMMLDTIKRLEERQHSDTRK